MSIASERPNVIRNRDFVARLEEACNKNPHCPDMHMGRLAWIRDQLKTRKKLNVSLESVRKWYSGESLPQRAKIELIADVLGVEAGWLHFGRESGKSAKTERVVSPTDESYRGTAKLVAGLIEGEGGVLLPKPRDVDIRAKIKRLTYDFVIVEIEADGAVIVPKVTEDAIVLGVLRKGFTVEIYEIPEDIGDGVEVGNLHKVDVTQLRKVETFTRRI